MKIIGLTGPSNTGKTTTLSIAYSLLCAEAAVIEKRESKGDDRKDFSCLLDYRGKKVAFSTVGDDRTLLIQAFDEYKDKCDILVCAISTNKGMHHGVKATVLKKGYEYETIPKTLYQDVTNVSKNLLDAGRIINAIEREVGDTTVTP